MKIPRSVGKFFNGFCVFVFITALLLSVAALSVAVFVKDDAGSRSLFGYRLTIMKNDSMYASVPEGSLIISSKIENPKPNSIVLFKNKDTNSLCVARFVSSAVLEETPAFVVKSDISSDATLVSADTVFEKIVFSSRKLGSVFSFFTSFYPFVICILLILLEIFLAVTGKIKSREQSEEKAVELKGEGNVDKTQSPKRKMKEQSPLNLLIEEQKKHAVSALQTEEDTELSPDEARELFSKMSEDKTASEKPKQTAEDIDALVDGILEEVN